MISFVNAILGAILSIICWLLFSVLTMVHLRLTAKKKWNKNEKMYPYFHYPIYKKIFLLGLKGALNRINVIVTFLFNITIIILFILTIWYLILPTIVVSYILRVMYGIYLIVWLLTMGVYVGCPPNF